MRKKIKNPKAKNVEAMNQANQPVASDVKGKGKLIEPSNEATEPTSSRKHKSLSSLVNNANGASKKTATAARGGLLIKSKVRKAIPPPPRASLSKAEQIEIDENHFERSSIPNPSISESSKQETGNKVNITKLKRLDVKSVPHPSQAKESESKGKESTSVDSFRRESKVGRPPKIEETVVHLDLNIPAHFVVDSAALFRHHRTIWFQLVASDNKESPGPLPPIPPFYIMVGDVNMPAFFIKKYLVLKLGLDSENEVEIRMRDQPVHPHMQLHQLIELWVKTATRLERKKIATIGSSGKDFVMVFTYHISHYPNTCT